MKRILSVAALLLFASPAAWASVCSTATLDTYTASGFTCTIGALEFSNFKWETNILAADQFGTANQPSAILLTPQNSGGEMGFNISNLGLSFFGALSNRTSGVDFDVAALSGAIGDASLSIGTHSSTGEGAAYGFFGDTFSTSFTLTVADPALGSPYDTPLRLTDSDSFTGVTSLSTYSGVAAIVTGFGGGNASVGDYTVTLSLASTQVPEPASLALLGLGLAGLGLARRRR